MSQFIRTYQIGPDTPQHARRERWSTTGPNDAYLYALIGPSVQDRAIGYRFMVWQRVNGDRFVRDAKWTNTA